MTRHKGTKVGIMAASAMTALGMHILKLRQQGRCESCGSPLVLGVSRELGECEGCRHENYHRNSH